MKDVTWRERLENIIEAVVSGVVVLDKDGCFVYMNTAAEKILGLTRSGIIGHTYKDVALSIITADGELVLTKELPYAQVVATGKPLCDVELAIEHPDGVRVMVSISAVPFRDDNGTLKGMVASLIDITEQKRAERALIESEARLQAILDNTTAIIYIKDTEGHYLLVNHHQVELLHMTKEELLGKTDYDIFPKQRAELLRANDQIRYVYGLPQELLGMRFTDKDFKGSVAAARTREPIVINDAFHDEMANRELVERYNIRSMLIVP
ncbi:MAG TPA: PAS domain-containing protein, partial [Anaerolineae bacterium]|nr:PAS domain-containing protein [Anaerolineae bacterium]